VFRRCPDCRERNLVKDDDFRCALCGVDLPSRWNVDPDPHALPVPPEQGRRLDFLLAAHELTGVTRVNRLLDGSRGETSAEHSWHLAVAALALAEDVAPTVDVGRVVAMLLIHDLPEVYAGDVPIYDEQARLSIVAAEEAAAARLFAKLPAGQGDRMLALWHEFERAESDDARFAKAIDRLQPLLLHWAGDGAAWAERRVTVAQEQRIMAAVGTYWPPLGPVAAALVADARRRGMLVEC
jgi:putative hydrolase of HD superfamily